LLSVISSLPDSCVRFLATLLFKTCQRSACDEPACHELSRRVESNSKKCPGTEKLLEDTTNGPRIGPKPASSIPTKTAIIPDLNIPVTVFVLRYTVALLIKFCMIRNKPHNSNHKTFIN
jgi:hypothetical protein